LQRFNLVSSKSYSTAQLAASARFLRLGNQAPQAWPMTFREGLQDFKRAVEFLQAHFFTSFKFCGV